MFFLLIIIILLVLMLMSRILANIMDQLGDLGRHAVDIMDGIGLNSLYIYIYSISFRVRALIRKAYAFQNR